MDCGEYKVTGFRRLESDVHRFDVSHLSNENNVRRLTQNMPQSDIEVISIDAYFTLTDDRLLVLVDKLNRVFNRDNINLPMCIEEIDHRGKSCRLAGAGGSGN